MESVHRPSNIWRNKLALPCVMLPSPFQFNLVCHNFADFEFVKVNFINPSFTLAMFCESLLARDCSL